ncbi:protein FMP52-1, mitochondrial [Scheffersomyces amazonensis]|uniref:protein FMP52-1, mitochondrial n=1 Tax=Scheffersomyces amazonensis TaxID=1078765 RepID=UPI00315CA07B
MSAFILGSTGLVGFQILRAVDKSTFYNKISTVSRRKPAIESDKLNSIVEKDSDKWTDIIKKEAKGASTFFSGFGTTRAAAGSADNFKKIDYGVNYDAAKAAREAGVETIVLISTVGANPNSYFLYFKTKGELENAIIALEFPRTIILRPGPLLGERDKAKDFLNTLSAKVFQFVHGTRFSFFGNPIYGEELGQVAVNLSEEPFTKSDVPIVKFVDGGELTALSKKL